MRSLLDHRILCTTSAADTENQGDQSDLEQHVSRVQLRRAVLAGVWPSDRRHPPIIANAITLALACTVLLLKLKNEYLTIH